MYKLEGGVSYDYTPTYDELYNDYKRGAIDKNALIDLAQKRKELDYKQANNQQLKDTTLDGVRAVIGGGLEGASFHPILNIPYVGTGLGGALFEWGDSINNKRSAIDTLKNMGKGFVVGETVGAIPYAGKAIGKTKVGSKFGDIANKAYQRIADTSIGAKMGQGLNKVGDLLMTDVLPNGNNEIQKSKNLYDYLMNDSISTKDYSKNKEIIDNNVKNLYGYLVSPKEVKKRDGYINLGGNNENLYDKLINMDENIPKYIEKTYIIPATSRHYEGGHTTPAANKLFDKLFAGEKVDRNLLDERMQGYYDAYKSGIYKRVEGKPGRTETRKVLNPEWVNANPYYDAPQYGQDDIDDIIEHFEKSISTDKIGHGYSHYSMSNNAKTAYSKGSKPLSKWTKKAIIDRIDEVIKGYNLPLNIDDYKKIKINELKNYLKKQGYHHTSKYYNITDFYDLDLYKLLEY